MRSPLLGIVASALLLAGPAARAADLAPAPLPATWFGVGGGIAVSSIPMAFLRVEGVARRGPFQVSLAAEGGPPVMDQAYVEPEPGETVVSRREVYLLAAAGGELPVSGLLGGGWLSHHAHVDLLGELGWQHTALAIQQYGLADVEASRWTPVAGARLGLGFRLGTSIPADLGVTVYGRLPLHERGCVPTPDGCEKMGQSAAGVALWGRVDFPAR